MTATMHRTYPPGWDQGYCVVRDDGDPYVPFASGNAQVIANEEAAEAERLTGARMEVFRYARKTEQGWAYRPALAGGES